MESIMKYKIISSEEQYDKYCKILHDLDFAGGEKSQEIEDEIQMLVWLIRKWDDEHSTFRKLNPIELIKSLMEDHKMKPKDLAELLAVNKSYISEILSYKKGLSKDMIRKLSERFRISQEAFNRPYELKRNLRPHKRNAKAAKKTKVKRRLVYA